MESSGADRTGRNVRVRRGWSLLCGLLLAVSAINGNAAPGWWQKNDWTHTDTALQLSYTALHIADWGQTLDIENHANAYETNPILGRSPSRGEINTYFASTLALHWLIARVLPQKWRSQFQLGTIALEFDVISENHSAGIRLNF